MSLLNTGTRAGTILLACVVAALLAPGAWASGWPLVACADGDNLPYSNRAGEGFENRIAALLADELGADLSYVWVSAPFGGVHVRLLQQGSCDLVMAVADGQAGYETSVAYYRSSYVFVQRSDHPRPIASFDDEALMEMQIGLLSPEGGRYSPPMQALATRDLIENQRTFVANRTSSEPIAALMRAVTDGDVDVGIAWGPIAGYFAQDAPAALDVTPVQPQIDVPFVPMVGSVSIGVRAGEVELAERLSEALARRWPEVQSLLEDYGVPLLALPRPSVAE